MMLTLEELSEKLLQQYDICDIIYLLDISAEDLLDRFDFRLAERYDELNEELSDEQDT